jgi:hypothetical protein
VILKTIRNRVQAFIDISKISKNTSRVTFHQIYWLWLLKSFKFLFIRIINQNHLNERLKYKLKFGGESHEILVFFFQFLSCCFSCFYCYTCQLNAHKRHIFLWQLSLVVVSSSSSSLSTAAMFVSVIKMVQQKFEDFIFVLLEFFLLDF